MPIFDFACDECGHKFEKLQLKSDAPAPDCISCKGKKVTKQISAPAFRLGGSGWYETDFKTGKKKNLASTDNETSSSSTDKKSSSNASDSSDSSPSKNKASGDKASTSTPSSTSSSTASSSD